MEENLEEQKQASIPKKKSGRSFRAFIHPFRRAAHQVIIPHSRDLLSKKRSVLFLFGSFFVVLFLIFSLAASIAFFTYIRGPEKVLTPNVLNEHITDAILTLQKKGLFAEIQMRYHMDTSQKNHVIGIYPLPGSLIRLGRRVRLTVSKGLVVTTMKDYVGRHLSDVQLDLQREYAGLNIDLSLNSISYVFSEEESGIVLAQLPEAGSSLSGNLKLSLVVSRGQETTNLIVPDYVEQDFQTVLSDVSSKNIPFQFSLSEDADFTDKSRVISQTPPPYSPLMPGFFIQFFINRPRLDSQSDLVFDFLSLETDQTPFPLSINLVRETSEGEVEEVFSMLFSGGILVLPYLERPGTVFRFYREGVLLLSYRIAEPN